MVGVQIDRPRPLPRTELVGVGERILQEFHDGNDAGRLVLDLLDRRAHFAKVGQRQRNAAAALGKLERRIDGAADALHVVLDAQQETRDEFAALLLAGIEKGRRRRLETTGNDLVDEIAGELLVAARQRHRHHADTVLITLQVAFPVEGLQRVGRVIFERAEEGRETEFLVIGMVEEVAHKIEGILVQHLLLVVTLRHQIIELLPEIVEEDRVLVDVLEEILLGRLPVLVELDFSIRVIKVQHGVERMIIQRGDFRRLGRFLERHRVQNRSSPCLTLSTSSSVPSSSKR
jgi:hypothetical protein